jgi:hypothetical protein
MNSFRQHIPTFVDTDGRPPDHNFETTQQLLDLEVVRRYSDVPGFSHFALEDNTLLSISDGGFHWWVAGFIKHPELVNLPQWEGWKFRVLVNGKERILTGDEVVSSCGNVLTLRDGTQVVDETR